ncbi:carbonic anhydrase 13-like [Glandiceps talaboti]
MTSPGDSGPNYWPEKYPTCGGDNQSPINIVTYDALPKSMGKLVWNADGGEKVENTTRPGGIMILENKGYTVQVSFTSDFYVSGGGLPAKYKLVELHFHWALQGFRGSEHSLNGYRHPAEMHLVGYNSEKFADINEAKSDSQGIMVLGTFIKVEGQDNEHFSELFSGFDSILYKGQKYTFTSPLPVLSMLPHDTWQFYRYSGSLTTPNCDEAVVWTMFENHVEISQQQYDNFLKLYTNEFGETNIPLGDNYRPIQALNSRRVYRQTDDPSPESSSATSIARSEVLQRSTKQSAETNIQVVAYVVKLYCGLAFSLLADLQYS